MTLSPSHRRIALFFAKMLAIYGAWYVLYDLWLLPDGRLDAWLSRNVAWMSGTLLQGLGVETIVHERSVTLPDVRGIEVANGCNGLTTIGLFIGFVIAFPGSWRRRLWFIPLGIFAIYVTNVGRLMVMLLTQRYWPAAFDPLHGFGLTAIFYVVVFALWVAWVHYGSASSERTPSVAPALG